MATQPNDPQAPASLGRCGRYELLVELAAGGMATVFLARAVDARDAPLVAIKRPHRHLAGDKAYLTMLVDEARLASAIRHDNVVRVRELGFENGEPFIALDYVEGASLADIRRELSAARRALDPRVAVRIAIDALAGLHAAHVLHDERGKPLGIVHRDVSPHNLLVGCDGTTKLTDFGIAKAADRVQVTQTHEVKGKLAYIAPERIDKRRTCTPQSDVFSMAVVLWECIAGRRLFRGDEALETLQDVVSAPIPSLRRIGAAVTPELDEAISRGLSRDLETRYVSALDFAYALEHAAGRPNIAAPAEIAYLIEALFGERLRMRHDKIRRALDGRDVEHVLEISGLHPRPAPTPEMREREQQQLDSMAPPAPSARYVFGSGSERSSVLSSPRVRLAASAVSGAALVALLVVVALTRKPAARVTAPAASPVAIATRRVIVPLPFVATRVTFDAETRELSPSTDLVVFDVPFEASTQHRVLVVGAEGAHAEASLREVDGVARAEDPGFKITPAEDARDDGPDAGAVLELTPSAPVRHSTARPHPARPPTVPPPAAPAPTTATAADAKPIGTMKDGFTKLR